MESVISNTIELAVMLGDKTAKLVYKLTNKAERELANYFELAVSMSCDGQEESEQIKCSGTSQSRVYDFFQRLIEGAVMPMSLQEVGEDFLAVQE